MSNATNLTDQIVYSYEYEGYTNRVLTQREINKFLSSHRYDLLETPDTTGWTLFDMLAFLGY